MTSSSNAFCFNFFSTPTNGGELLRSASVTGLSKIKIRLHSDQLYPEGSGPALTGSQSTQPQHDHANFKTTAFLRPQVRLVSSKVNTTFSVSASRLNDRCQNNTSTKNKISRYCSKSHAANTFGIVINISAGPALRRVGSPPRQNTRMIIGPAII